MDPMGLWDYGICRFAPAFSRIGPKGRFWKIAIALPACPLIDPAHSDGQHDLRWRTFLSRRFLKKGSDLFCEFVAHRFRLPGIETCAVVPNGDSRVAGDQDGAFGSVFS